MCSLDANQTGMHLVCRHDVISYQTRSVSVSCQFKHCFLVSIFNQLSRKVAVFQTYSWTGFVSASICLLTKELGRLRKMCGRPKCISSIKMGISIWPTAEAVLEGRKRLSYLVSPFGFIFELIFRHVDTFVTRSLSEHLHTVYEGMRWNETFCLGTTRREAWGKGRQQCLSTDQL